MNIVKMALPILSAALTLSAAAAVELKNTDTGSSLEIVASPQTDPTAKYAAAELQKYLGKITGIASPIAQLGPRSMNGPRSSLPKMPLCA